MDLLTPLHQKFAEIGNKMRAKEINFPVDLWSGIIMLGVGLFIYLTIPGQIEVSPKDPVNGRVFPQMITILMMICSAFLIIKECVKVFKGQPLETKKLNLLVEVKALIIFLILVVTFLICKYTDLFVIGAVFCAISFLIYFRSSKLSYYVITVALAVLIWVAFKYGLNVNF